jgi:hypothetical protein
MGDVQDPVKTTIAYPLSRDLYDAAVRIYLDNVVETVCRRRRQSSNGLSLGVLSSCNSLFAL